MKKFLKISAAVAAIAIVFGLMWYANGLLGNPVSKMLAKNAAENYISEVYPNDDFFIESVNYSFKEGGYYVQIKSPSSQDTYFSLLVSMLGKVEYDYFENVSSGMNTYLRIDDEYRRMVDAVINSDDFPVKGDIYYGTIKAIDDSEVNGFGKENYGIKMSSLELDKQYNVKELAKSAGSIVFYAKDKEVSIKRASELLLKLKEAFDRADVPFYAIDFVLQKPDDYGETSINTEDFLYSEIYEDGLEERLRQADAELKQYYAEKDAEKQSETL